MSASGEKRSACAKQEQLWLQWLDVKCLVPKMVHVNVTQES